jgi:CheY-like chemotaxis protein
VLLLLVTLTMTGLFMLRGVVRTTAQLRAANRAQSEFLANMSHEFRTPLNGVIGIAGALAKTPLTARQLEFVEVIRGSGETLEHLLSDVLDLSNMETGEITIRNAPFDPIEAVRAVVGLHERRARAKGVEVRLVIDPAVEASVVGDASRVKQILTSLLDNAVKFTDKGGVTVQIDRTFDAALRLRIEDTGIGFEPGQARRIFRRFCQADGSVTRKYGGAGLGLSIAEHLATLMGGSIKAEGRPGEGATFTVLLPLPPADAKAAAEEAPAAVDADQTVRILLSDDHPTNRQVVQALLADAGVELVATENGLEACEAFERGGFQIVLMDMQMPVMDGLAAIRRIRETEARDGKPRAFIIMLTANALPEHREASLAAGADLHVPKPIQADRLFAAINQAFEGPAEEEAAVAA